MESLALLHGSSLTKLPLYAPSSSTIPTTASWLRFDLRNLSFPQLSNGSVHVSFGPTWNRNIRDKFLTHCGNNNAYYGDWKTHSDAKEDPLKSLLSLVQPKEKNSSCSTIISIIKNEALKLVVDERYDEAECRMKQLCDGDADVAYEARLAHVQILIHLDEFEKALEFLEKTGNFPPCKPLDARLCLYKAVAHTMLGKDDDKAKEWWNAYLQTLGNGNGNGNEKNKNKNENENVEYEKLISHCKDYCSSEWLVIVQDGKELLKPLLSLKPGKQQNNSNSSSLSNIIPTKNMALKKVMNGEYGAAEWDMRRLCKAVKTSEEALEAQLAYLQILIRLDKYEEALKRLSELLHDFPPSDARPFLYTAIGLTVLGNHEDAKICWAAFMNTIGSGFPPPQST